MTGLDTNVLVRYLTRDDADQYQRAKAFLETTCTETEPGYINTIVLCELIWVLKAAYGATKKDLAGVVEHILLTRQFEVAHRDAAWAALRDFKQGNADFADCLIGRLNLEKGCIDTATFDQKAGTLDGFRVL